MIQFCYNNLYIGELKMAIDIASGRIGDGPSVPEMGNEAQQAPQVQMNNAAAFAQPNYQNPTTSL